MVKMNFAHMVLHSLLVYSNSFYYVHQWNEPKETKERKE